MNWWKNLKGKVSFREPLNKHTTFKIGGPAEIFFEPRDLGDLKLLVIAAKKYNIPIFLIGAGSNILVSDKGIKAVVLKLSSPYFKKISFKNSSLEVGSGLMLNRIVQIAQKRGFTGTEFLAGIPGTVGGALAMNAGAWGKSIGELLQKVRVMDYNGSVKTLTKENIKFTYRRSNLGRFIILSADLKLYQSNKKVVRENINMYISRRRKTQDTTFANAGCIFRNPAGESAGRLIDLCGLKGRRRGKAYISTRHANFILNRGNAFSSDVLSLMDLVRKKVKGKFNITLKPEIKIWY
jgi:UDP-N-acetylmuramate dehydrogenase